MGSEPVTLPLYLALLAGGPSSFVIEPPACPPAWFDGPTLERMLLADTSSVGRVYVAVVIPECETAPRDVQVAVIQPSRPPRQTPVALGDVPDVLALRTLALAVGDLLQDRTIDPPLVPVAPPPPPPSAEVVAPKASTPVQIAVDAGAALVAHPGAGTTIFGARAGGAVALGALVLPVGVSFATASRSIDRGDVAVRALALDLGIGVRLVRAQVTWGAGLVAEGGLVFVAATTPDGRTGRQTRYVLRAALALSAAIPFFAESWYVFADVRPGLSVRGVDVESDDERLLGLSGPFVGASVGVRYVFAGG